MSTKTKTPSKKGTRKAATKKSAKAVALGTSAGAVISTALEATEGLTSIPLDRLSLMPGNPRKTVDETPDPIIMASIRSVGLLENLGVVPDPENDGHFLVAYGQRRLICLKALAEAGDIASDYPTPSRILVGDDAARLEAQIAENMCRKAVPPVDEFEAFAALADEGLEPDEIAERYGITERSVLERLALGRAAPAIREAARNGEISLSILKVYANCPDQDRQLSVFENISRHAAEWTVKSALREGGLDTTSAVVQFVTVAEYEAAGGTVQNNLLDDGAMLTDPTLVYDLRDKKLQGIVNGLLDAGWKWAEVVEDDYHAGAGMRHVPGTELAKTDEQTARMQEIEDILEEMEGEPYTAEGYEKQQALSEEYDELSVVILEYSEEEMAKSGCYVNYSNGRVDITKGLIRPEDDDEAPKASKASAKSTAKETVKPIHTNALAQSLACYRMQAARAAYVERPAVAARLLEFTLFRKMMQESCYKANTRIKIEWQNEGPELQSGKAVDVYRKALANVPKALTQKDFLKGFAAYQALKPRQRDKILAVVFAKSLTHLSDGAGVEVAVLKSEGATVRDHFTPDGESYFTRISKGPLLGILDGILGDRRPQYLGNSASKGECVTFAESLFSGSLPGLPDTVTTAAAEWTPPGMAYGTSVKLTD